MSSSEGLRPCWGKKRRDTSQTLRGAMHADGFGARAPCHALTTSGSVHGPGLERICTAGVFLQPCQRPIHQLV